MDIKKTLSRANHHALEDQEQDDDHKEFSNNVKASTP